MKITTDYILKTLTDYVENRKHMDAHQWIDTAQKLNVLIYQEHDKLYLLQQDVAKAKQIAIELGDSVAKAEVKVETGDLYRQMCLQKAKISQVEEMIRIAKHQARLKETEYHNQ